MVPTQVEVLLCLRTVGDDSVTSGIFPQFASTLNVL